MTTSQRPQKHSHISGDKYAPSRAERPMLQVRGPGSRGRAAHTKPILANAAYLATVAKPPPNSAQQQLGQQSPAPLGIEDATDIQHKWGHTARAKTTRAEAAPPGARGRWARGQSDSWACGPIITTTTEPTASRTTRNAATDCTEKACA